MTKGAGRSGRSQLPNGDDKGITVSELVEFFFDSVMSATQGDTVFRAAGWIANILSVIAWFLIALVLWIPAALLTGPIIGTVLALVVAALIVWAVNAVSGFAGDKTREAVERSRERRD